MSVAEPLTYKRSGSLPGKSPERRTTHEPSPIRPYASLCDVLCVVDEGVAVLRGRVPSFYLKQLAQERARKMEGVNTIVNELEVVRSAKPSGMRPPK